VSIIPWQDAITNGLKPYQWAVTLGLLITIAVSVYVLVRGTAISRTAWLAWVISP